MCKGSDRKEIVLGMTESVSGGSGSVHELDCRLQSHNFLTIFTAFVQHDIDIYITLYILIL